MTLNFRYLVLIRVIAMCGLICGLIVMWGPYGIHFPVLPVASVIGALCLFTLASWLRLRKRAHISESTFTVQLLVDVAALTAITFYSGGAVNPFISLFLLPVVFAAAGMRPPYALLIALVAFACYTVLMFFSVPVLEMHSNGTPIQAHVWGMWYGFALSAGLIAFFVSRVARALRERDHALGAAREDALRADKAIALGTLAAGTAHELGTPLSTMAVLCREIERDHSNDLALRDNLGILRNQIERCKGILSNMASDAGELHAEGGRPTYLASYLQEMLDDWRSVHCDTAINVHLEGARPGPLIIADKTLTHALVNILNNAADAANGLVEFDARWTGEQLNIRVHDDGKGLDPGARAAIGRKIYSGKPADHGMGLGLLLAHTTVKRLGGFVRLIDREPSGTGAEIEMPLKSLLAPAG